MLDSRRRPSTSKSRGTTSTSTPSFQQCGRGQDDVVRSRGEGDQDVIDLLLVHDALEIAAGAEDGRLRRSPNARCSPRSSGSLSRNPTGTMPSARFSSMRFAVRCPTRPAPTISVRPPVSGRAAALPETVEGEPARGHEWRRDGPLADDPVDRAVGEEQPAALTAMIATAERTRTGAAPRRRRGATAKRRRHGDEGHQRCGCRAASSRAHDRLRAATTRARSRAP